MGSSDGVSAFWQLLESLLLLMHRVGIENGTKEGKNVWMLAVCCMISSWRARRSMGWWWSLCGRGLSLSLLSSPIGWIVSVNGCCAGVGDLDSKEMICISCARVSSKAWNAVLRVMISSWISARPLAGDFHAEGWYHHHWPLGLLHMFVWGLQYWCWEIWQNECWHADFHITFQQQCSRELEGGLVSADHWWVQHPQPQGPSCWTVKWSVFLHSPTVETVPEAS